MAFTAEAVSAELTASIKTLVEVEPGGTVKERTRSTARHLGMPFGRIRKYFYGEVVCPPAHEADQIRAYYNAAQELIEARKAYEKLRGDFLRDNPSLARFAPGPLKDTDISNAARLAAESELARR